MIDKMASDLGILRFSDESRQLYSCRVIYSAMASWIKAIALDKPIGNKDGCLGVSRRHVYERSKAVFDMILKMYPEVSSWFDLSEEYEHPVLLIRTRLINHGDLLNEGFNTNLVLSAMHSVSVSDSLETVYGKVIGDEIHYSGVSAVRSVEGTQRTDKTRDVIESLRSYLKETWWSTNLPETSTLQYFNPESCAKNNYMAWQDEPTKVTEGVVLSRTIVNKNTYEYYLLKPAEKLYNRLDPFLLDQGFHIRIMYALRSCLNNRAVITVARFHDHVNVTFNAILPVAERLILESYAWPVSHLNDKLTWTMDCQIWSVVEPCIKALHLRIVEEKHG